ncbi:hypothetical protein ACQPWY_26825 [Pseudonocardia xinjiangensis]|uniref:hypothetical protein n=1 Tax=Pseudonocardia xinjiangensis TaxID=75289 RepID=UPI003D93714F
MGGELAHEWTDLKLWTIGRVALRHNFQPRELDDAHFGSAGHDGVPPGARRGDAGDGRTWLDAGWQLRVASVYTGL